jgi:hypothetical protein
MSLHNDSRGVASDQSEPGQTAGSGSSSSSTFPIFAPEPARLQEPYSFEDEDQPVLGDLGGRLPERDATAAAELHHAPLLQRAAGARVEPRRRKRSLNLGQINFGRAALRQVNQIDPARLSQAVGVVCRRADQRSVVDWTLALFFPPDIVKVDAESFLVVRQGAAQTVTPSRGSSLGAAPGNTPTLVCCSRIKWAFAAMNFWFRRGVSDEHTRHGSVRSEQRSLSQKGMPPGGLGEGLFGYRGRRGRTPLHGIASLVDSLIPRLEAVSPWSANDTLAPHRHRDRALAPS